MAAAGGADQGRLAFDIVEGRNLNSFLRDGPVAAHMLLRSGRDPRILVVFPAGNSGVGLWFEPTAGPVSWRLVERAEARRPEGREGPAALRDRDDGRSQGRRADAQAGGAVLGAGAARLPGHRQGARPGADRAAGRRRPDRLVARPAGRRGRLPAVARGHGRRDLQGPSGRGQGRRDPPAHHGAERRAPAHPARRRSAAERAGAEPTRAPATRSTS